MAEDSGTPKVTYNANAVTVTFPGREPYVMYVRDDVYHFIMQLHKAYASVWREV